MSLREAIESRAPRRVRASIARPGREDDLASLRERRAIVDLLRAAPDTDPARMAAAEQALAEIERAAGDAEDQIEVQALPAATFEAMVSAFVDERTGEVNQDAMRPHLLAASAVDPELQDHAWWAEQLTGGRLSAGDVATLWAACWRVNAAQGDITGPLGV